MYIQELDNNEVVRKEVRVVLESQWNKSKIENSYPEFIDAQIEDGRILFSRNGYVLEVAKPVVRFIRIISPNDYERGVLSIVRECDIKPITFK